MTDTILLLLALALPALAALTAAGLVWPAWKRAVLGATAGLCGALGLGVGFVLLADGGEASLAVPVGPPGLAVTLGLDALSGLFLVALFVTGAACAVFALGPQEAEQRRATVLLPLLVACLALTLLAADGFALALGVMLTAGAVGASALARSGGDEARAAAAAQLVMGGGAAICLAAACALLGPDGAPSSFAAIRAAPPEGWRAAGGLLLALAGGGTAAGLAPLHGSLRAATGAAPGPIAALIAAAGSKVGLYLLLRFTLDLCGSEQPLWWFLPALAVGAGSALRGGFEANMGEDLQAVLAGGATQNAGLAVTGLGVALLARGSDLPALAALSVAASLLLALTHALSAALLGLAHAAAEQGAGSRLFARLGGLIHQTPRATLCALAAAIGLAALPPGPGFAGAWLLLQSLASAAHAGGVALSLVVALSLAAAAMTVALGSASMTRLIGVAFLGRPRSPRAAAASEPDRWALGAMAALAGLCGVAGLAPGAALALAEPAVRELTGSGLDGWAGWLTLAPTAEGFGYTAFAVGLLLAALGAAAFFGARALSVKGRREASAWDGGFAAPPPWLPFGDPATQYTASSFAQPLRAALTRGAGRKATWLGEARSAFSAAASATPRFGLRAAIGALGAILLASLAALVWMQTS